jgi:spermidine synthase
MERKNFILIGFFLSNMAALIYEVVWGRELGYVFGTTAYAISTVLASFMAGLSLGSYFFGKLSDRRDPVRLFVLLELGIGFYGLFTLFIFSELTHPFLFIVRNFSGQAFLFTQFLTIFSFLSIPTTLIGGTFPVINKIYAVRFKELGEKVGVVYSLDTLGAAAGAFLSGFLLIPVLGLNLTTLFAATVNIFVGVTIFQIFPRGSVLRSPKREKTFSLFNWIVLVSFFISGFAALGYEIVLAHLLTIVFSTSIYAFSLILTALMLGLGLGSYLISKVVDKLRDPVGTFIALEVGIGLYFILLLSVFSKMDIIFLKLYQRFNDSFAILFGSFFMVFLALLLVPTTLMGASLPLVSRIFARKLSVVGLDVGSVFSTNTAGGIFGSLMAGFILIPFVGVEKTVITLAILNLIAGSLLLNYSKLKKQTFMVILVVFLGVTAAYSSYAVDPLIGGAYYYGIRFDSIDEYKEHKNSQTILFQQEDPHGSVTATGGDDVTALHINGKIDASNSKVDLTTEYMLAYAPLMFHKDPEKVLNIGLGGGFTLSSIEDFRDVKSIDVVEINPAVVEATKRVFPELNDNALVDPRLSLIIEDARNHLAVTNKKYDVIISEPSNMWLAGEGGLFTHEFYELAASRLNEGGIFAQWAPLFELGGRDLKVLLNTFQSVFPHVHVFVIQGGDIIIVGSLEETSYDYHILWGRFGSQKIERHFSKVRLSGVAGSPVPGPIEFFLSLYFMDPEEVEDYILGVGDLNTDDNLLLEFAAAKTHFRRRSFGETALADLIDFKRRRLGAITTSPRIINLVMATEKKDFYNLFNIEVERGVNWSIEDWGYGYIFHPESGSYNILRSFIYSTPAGKLSWIRIDNVPLSLRAEEVVQVIAHSQLVSPTFLEVFKTESGERYIYTDGQRLFAGWQCGEPNLNILILNSQDLEVGRGVFNRVNCISSN